jgi:hypothetical protein
MFQVAKNKVDFLGLLKEYFIDSGYPVPEDMPLDDLVYRTDHTLTFPSLVTFMEIGTPTGRITHVKDCKKTIAKTLVYPKTNKLPGMNDGHWALHTNISSYNDWYHDIRDDMMEEYDLSGSRILLPPEPDQSEIDGHPFLTSFKNFWKDYDSNKMWLQIFLITQSQAKELVYCNKPNNISWFTYTDATQPISFASDFNAHPDHRLDIGLDGVIYNVDPSYTTTSTTDEEEEEDDIQF